MAGWPAWASTANDGGGASPPGAAAAADRDPASSGEATSSSSDDEALPTRLPLQPIMAHVPLLAQRAQSLSLRARRLDGDKVGLKAVIGESRRKRGEFGHQCHSHIKDRQRCQQVLQARIEALETERSDLQVLSVQQDKEQRQIDERLQEVQAQESETEQRIQRLMDRLVALLSANSTPETLCAQFAEVQEELKASEERLGRMLVSMQRQHEAARGENRQKAMQLSEEQRRTKRLHDTLCQLQGELFLRYRGRRPSGCRPEGWATALPPPGPAASASASQARVTQPAMPSQEQEVDAQSEGAMAKGEVVVVVTQEPAAQLVAPEPVRRATTAPAASGAQAGLRAPLTTAPAAWAAAGGAADTALPNAAAVDDRPAVSPQMAVPAGDDGGAFAEAPPATPPPALPAVGAARAFPTKGDKGSPLLPSMSEHDQAAFAAESPARLGAMESRLRGALEAAQFESVVVRLGPGYYQFGKMVRAWVHLNADGQVYVSQNEVDHEPIEAFLTRISLQEGGKDAFAAPAPTPTPAATQSPGSSVGVLLAPPPPGPGAQVQTGSPPRPQARMQLQVPPLPASAAPPAPQAQALAPPQVAPPQGLVPVASPVPGPARVVRTWSPTPPRAGAGLAVAALPPTCGGTGAGGRPGDEPVCPSKEAPQFPQAAVPVAQGASVPSPGPAVNLGEDPSMRSAVSLGQVGPAACCGSGCGAGGGNGSINLAGGGGGGFGAANYGSANYGSGNYGSGNYGSGNYSAGSSCAVAMAAVGGAKSPCRGFVLGVGPGPNAVVLSARSSPARTNTPRASPAPRAVTPTVTPLACAPREALWKQSQARLTVTSATQHNHSMQGGGGSSVAGAGAPTEPAASPRSGRGVPSPHGSPGGSAATAAGSSSAYPVAPTPPWVSPPRNSVLPQSPILAAGRCATGPLVSTPWQLVPASGAAPGAVPLGGAVGARALASSPPALPLGGGGGAGAHAATLPPLGALASGGGAAAAVPALAVGRAASASPVRSCPPGGAGGIGMGAAVATATASGPPGPGPGTPVQLWR